MNTYACWHQGRTGYCFEHPRSGWWFIPEQGESDTRICRHLSLQDFVFANRSEQRFEHQRQHFLTAMPWWRHCLRALSLPIKPQTVAGLLLLPVLH